MSKKKLNTEGIVNELRGASSFFRAQGNDEAEHAPAEAEQPRSRPSRTPRPERTPDRPARRQMVRHPFEVYHDQVERLRRLALEDRLAGGTGSMSHMVREALDRLILERDQQPG